MATSCSLYRILCLLRNGMLERHTANLARFRPRSASVCDGRKELTPMELSPAGGLRRRSRCAHRISRSNWNRSDARDIQMSSATPFFAKTSLTRPQSSKYLKDRAGTTVVGRLSSATRATPHESSDELGTAGGQPSAIRPRSNRTRRWE